MIYVSISVIEAHRPVNAIHRLFKHSCTFSVQVRYGWQGVHDRGIGRWRNRGVVWPWTCLRRNKKATRPVSPGATAWQRVVVVKPSESESFPTA